MTSSYLMARTQSTLIGTFNSPLPSPQTKDGPLIEIELSKHFFQEAARIQKLYTIRNYSSNLHVLPQQTRSHCTLISQDKSYAIKNGRYSTLKQDHDKVTRSLLYHRNQIVLYLDTTR